MLARVIAEKLNVRSLPSGASAILNVLNENKIVDTVSANGNWHNIYWNGRSGYVYSDYLTFDNDLRRYTGAVIASLLNVREGPSKHTPILGTLTRGTQIKLLSSVPGWLEIEFNNGIAYLSRQYVELHYSELQSMGRVTAHLLNIRAKPMRGAAILGQVAMGTSLEVHSQANGWSEVVFNGARAFVASRYLSLYDADDSPGIPIEADQDDDAELPPGPVEEHHPETALQPTSLIVETGSSQTRKVARTWNRFGGLLEVLGDEHLIDVASTVAVLCVESSGKGFEHSNQNRMIIRFENHKFWKYWGKENPEQYKRHFQYQSGKVWKGHLWRRSPQDDWTTFHGKQSREWEVFNFARSIDTDAAMLSISMGAPQIMGFHHERIGYPSVADMFDHFSQDIGAQIRGLFDFFDTRMITALRDLDFVTFAARYNGSGQKEKYGKWISEHYQAFKAIRR